MKKESLYLLSVTLGLLLVAGCGTKIKETVSPVNTSSLETQSSPLRIALLPFADYTAGFSPDDGMRRQVKLMAALNHEMARLGIYTPLDEDVIQCLADLGVIKVIHEGGRDVGRQFLERELASGWSDTMRLEVQRILANARALEETHGLEIKKVGLDRETLRELGQRLGTDYVLRGRIIEYEVRDGQGFNPLQRGILPFFFDFSSATVFGVARSETYDLWQDAALGGTLGAVFGSSANHPFNAPDKERRIVNGAHPRLATTVVHESGGFEDSAGLNAAFWGAAGAGAAYLASKGGRVPEAVVQVALALQDTRTGRVLWANRVEKEVEPVSVWSDTRVRTQVDVAVEEAARSLVRDLKSVLPRLEGQIASVHQGKVTWVSRITEKTDTATPGEAVPNGPGREKPGKPMPENWGS